MNGYITAPEIAAKDASISVGALGSSQLSGLSSLLSSLLESSDLLCNILGSSSELPSTLGEISTPTVQVPPDTARRIYVIISAIESATTMKVGLFYSIYSNELHARVSAAAAVSLLQLQVMSYMNSRATNVPSLSGFTSGALGIASRTLENVICTASRIRLICPLTLRGLYQYFFFCLRLYWYQSIYQAFICPLSM